MSREQKGKVRREETKGTRTKGREKRCEETGKIRGVCRGKAYKAGRGIESGDGCYTIERKGIVGRE
jgi:hypothetical protein